MVIRVSHGRSDFLARRLIVKPGQIGNFRALTTEMVESTRHEAGVVNYERFVSADGNLVHVFERYKDSAAAVEHLQRFTKSFSARCMTMVERTRFTVFGNPSDELRGIPQDAPLSLDHPRRSQPARRCATPFR